MTDQEQRVVPTTTTLGIGGLWGRVADFAFGLPAIATVLCIILGIMSYGGWVGIPALVDKMDAGYQRIEEKRNEEARQMRQEHVSELTQTRKDFMEVNSQQRKDLLSASAANAESMKAAIKALNESVVWLSKLVEKLNLIK